MDILINKRQMGLPTTPSSLTDWTFLGTLWGILLSIIAIAYRWIDSSFASRKLERETFIRTVVNEVMTSCLKEMNDKINSLFEYREKDRDNLDKKFVDMMKELRK